MKSNQNRISEKEMAEQEALNAAELEKYDAEFFSKEKEEFYASYQNAVTDCIDRNHK